MLTRFSTFPGGWPAVALLLLRLIVGVSACGQGILCLTHPTAMSYLFATVLLVFGLCISFGFATLIASIVVAIGMLLISTSWIMLPGQKLFECKQASLEYLTISLSVAMLGPGLFSVDARLFGRREIVIPPNSRPRQFSNPD